MTLSKLQQEQYKEIVKAFGNKDIIALDNKDYIRLKETLSILEALGYIQHMGIDNTNAFRKIGDFSDFDAWHRDKEREERMLSAREWKIGIVGAVIGLIPFFVTTVMPWIASLFRR